MTNLKSGNKHMHGFVLFFKKREKRGLGGTCVEGECVFLKFSLAIATKVYNCEQTLNNSLLSG